MCGGSHVSQLLQRKYLILLCLSGLMISLDQLSKIYVHTQFQLHESLSVIPPFFNITYVRNYGAAFGFLAQAPETFRDLFFLSVPPLACAIIVALLRSVENTDTRQIVALSLVFAGAIGNYIDRLQFRYVIDFFDFQYKAFSWPAFNIADMCIVIGVFSLIYLMLRESKPQTS